MRSFSSSCYALASETGPLPSDTRPNQARAGLLQAAGWVVASCAVLQIVGLVWPGLGLSLVFEKPKLPKVHCLWEKLQNFLHLPPCTATIACPAISARLLGISNRSTTVLGIFTPALPPAVSARLPLCRASLPVHCARSHSRSSPRRLRQLHNVAALLPAVSTHSTTASSISACSATAPGISARYATVRAWWPIRTNIGLGLGRAASAPTSSEARNLPGQADPKLTSNYTYILSEFKVGDFVNDWENELIVLYIRIYSENFSTFLLFIKSSRQRKQFSLTNRSNCHKQTGSLKTRGKVRWISQVSQLVEV